MKYIPKFYYAFLNDSTTGQLVPDGTLKEYEKYSGVSFKLLKQAQERSFNHGIVIAPGSVFTDEEEANEHGFILHRAFIDGGKVMPGFFIANTLLYYSASTDAIGGDTKYYYFFGAPELNHYEYDLTENRKQGLVRVYGDVPPIDDDFSESGGLDKGVTLCRKFSGFNLASVFMWSALSMLSFATGLYCKDATECAWYKTIGNIGPRGNNSTTKDIDDATVTFPAMSGHPDYMGTPFPSNEEQYAKTTHNGTISGITNVNGWLAQPLLGISDGYTKIMPESTVLANVLSLKEYLPNGETFTGVTSGEWGANSNSQSTTWFTQTSGAERAMCGVAPFAKAHPIAQNIAETSLFGSDYSTSKYALPYYNSVAIVGGDWGGGKNAGIFNRNYYDLGWTGTQMINYGIRLGGYPKVS